VFVQAQGFKEAVAMSAKTPVVFETDASGEVLDRLVGLRQFISAGQGVNAEGKVQRRAERKMQGSRKAAREVQGRSGP
jgi:hypothetical protein